MSVPQAKGASFLRSMSPLPLFKSSNSKQPSKQLSAKEKKYAGGIERALASFDSVDEWADYISYLSKLHKALQGNPEPSINHWVPQDFEISKTLSRCLSSKLPSGVHRKALEVYTLIFEILGPDNLSSDISIWLPGLLPLMSYASISVKPELIHLFHRHIVKIDPAILRVVFKSILLSLLPALDDTTSESFGSVMELIETFKKHLNNNSHFWQCLFLCIITSPDKRPGAMEWCIKKLPSFVISDCDKESQISLTSTLTSSTDRLSKSTVLDRLSGEARSCVTPEAGLLIRAFSEGLRDVNLYVQRGFFDLLVTKLPLDLDVLQVLVSDKDKETLILSAAGTVLRKDMSLNRRLWNWLLGPEHLEALSTATTSTTSAIPIDQHIPPITRLEYFQEYGLVHFSNSLFSLIKGTANSKSLLHQRIEACKIAIAIMDKWEIGQLVVPKILIPIVRCTKETYDSGSTAEFEELLTNTNEFFDGVETINIWSDILKSIRSNEVELVSFMLKNFHVEDEDMVVTHIPLILLGVLTMYDGQSNEWVDLIKLLLTLIPQRAFLPIEHADEKYRDIDTLFSDFDGFKADVINNLITFYNMNDAETNGEARAGESEATSKSSSNSTANSGFDSKPYTTADLSSILLSLLTYITSKQLICNNASSFYKFCEILNDLLEKIPPSEKEWADHTLIDSIKNYSFDGFQDHDVPVAFGISLIFKNLSRQTSKLELLKLLKVVMNLLWNCLVHPTGKYQVEAVKKIWNLEMALDSHYIEAALASIFLKCEYSVKIRAFNALWTHSSSYNESDDILTRPLQLVLDELNGDDEVDSVLVSKWIKGTLQSSSINRIFKICCSGLLMKNKFLDSGTFSNNDDDDFGLFAYQLKTVHNLLTVDTELIIPVFKSEMCVMDNDTEISIITNNHWSVSTYKSLLVTIILRFLAIKSPQSLEPEGFRSYSKCVKTSLNLLELLLDGTEPNFNDIPNLLTGLCNKTTSDYTYEVLVSFYLSTLTKVMKISSRMQINTTLFETPSNDVLSDFSEFIETGIQRSTTSVVLNAWIDLILKSSTFYPELVFRSTLHISKCICDKVEELFNFNKAYINNDSNITDIKVSDLDDSLSELINGLQEVLTNSHKYLNYLLTGSFNGSHGNQHSKETGFFGSVLQGVFQNDTLNEKNEEFNRRMMILKALKNAVTTCYKIWLWADENSKLMTTTTTTPFSPKASRKSSSVGVSLSGKSSEEEAPPFLAFTKSVNYNASKLKFRSKKILENAYSLEPLETLETLISCQKRQQVFNNSYSAFKIIHVLDGSRSQTTLPLLINSLISRVNGAVLDPNKKSSLITTLSEKDISSFLVDYVESLSNDVIEDIWPQLTHFLRDAQSNPTIYKFLYPDLLKFTSIIGVKLSQISFGDQKKIKKEMIDSFTKILSVSVNVKINLQDENPLTSLLNPMSLLPGAETDSTDSLSPTTAPAIMSNHSLNASSSNQMSGTKSLSSLPVPGTATREMSPSKETSDRAVIKEELCLALNFVIPKIQTIVQDSDKTLQCLTTIISSTVIPLIRYKPLNQVPIYVLALVATLSNLPQCPNLKIWKNLCFDLLMDSKFFSIKLNQDWNAIFLKWINEDKEKINDLIVKLLPYSGSSTLFNWNDSEISNRILTLKRVSYLLMISPEDSFLNYAKDLRLRVYDILRNSTNQSLKPYVFLLLRVMVTKFSEPHLATLWSIIYTELQLVLQDALQQLVDLNIDNNLEDANKEEISLNVDNDVILQSCKLLDVILLLRLEEPQLCNWLFISDTTDAVYRDSKVPILALTDKLSSLKNMRVIAPKSDLKVTVSILDDQKKKPLLTGFKKVSTVFDLRDFFDKLSIYNYENDYNMKTSDVEAVEQDLFDDLFV